MFGQTLANQQMILRNQQTRRHRRKKGNGEPRTLDASTDMSGGGSIPLPTKNTTRKIHNRAIRRDNGSGSKPPDDRAPGPSEPTIPSGVMAAAPMETQQMDQVLQLLEDPWETRQAQLAIAAEANKSPQTKGPKTEAQAAPRSEPLETESYVKWSPPKTGKGKGKQGKEQAPNKAHEPIGGKIARKG